MTKIQHMLTFFSTKQVWLFSNTAVVTNTGYFPLLQMFNHWNKKICKEWILRVYCAKTGQHIQSTVYAFTHSLCWYLRHISELDSITSEKKCLHSSRPHLGEIGSITVNLQAVPVQLAASIKVTLVSSYHWFLALFPAPLQLWNDWRGSVTHSNVAVPVWLRRKIKDIVAKLHSCDVSCYFEIHACLSNTTFVGSDSTLS